MISIVRTGSDSPDFISLVKLLDIELAERDGADHPFYAQYNKIDKIKFVVVGYSENKPVSCGAIKEYEPGTMEVKRMYTLYNYRGKGAATQILIELEKWAVELGFRKCILETGKKQPEAIRLYEKNGYRLIQNYGQYAEAANSLCFEKQISE